MKYEFEIESFTGFYESVWSSYINSEVDSEKEYLKDEYGADEELLDDLDTTSKWNKEIRQKIAEEYANIFFDLIETQLGIEFKYSDVKISSPNYYNYSTDRIFVTVEIEDWDELVNKLVALSEPHKERIAKYIHDNHTSYDGFISFMDNDYTEWLEDLKDPNNDFYLDCFIAYLLDIYMRKADNMLDRQCEHTNYIDGYIFDMLCYWIDKPCIEFEAWKMKDEWEDFQNHIDEILTHRRLVAACPQIPGLNA